MTSWLDGLSPHDARVVAALLQRGLRDAVRRDGYVPGAFVEPMLRDLYERADREVPAPVRRMSAIGRAPGTVASARWVTTAEAADLTGCSERHARRLAASGQVVARRVGSRSWLIDQESLVAVLRRAAA